MKLYLSGPMTGRKNFNRETFARVSERLRAAGHEVINPAEMDDDAAGFEWVDFLARDVPVILRDRGLEGLVLLDGWQQSKGASLEAMAAYQRGLPLLDEDLRVLNAHPEWAVLL